MADAPGDLPCSVAGYPNKHAVGTATSLACQLGTCACAASPSCGGDVDFFSQPNCATKTTTIPANDTCTQAVYTNGSTVQSVRYLNAQPDAGCTSSGAPTAQAGLANARTICCK